MKNNKRWTSLKLALFVPVVALLLQAFAKPELIVEKAEAYLPVIAQQDSSEVWLENWSIQNLSKISNGLEMNQFEVAPPPPGSNQERFPKYDKTKHGNPIPSENIMTILINQKSQILACDARATVDGVRDGVKNFLNGNPPFEQVEKGPEFIDKNLPLVGDVKISKGVILLRYDAESDKVFVDKLLRSIGKIHLERRQQLAQEKFSQDYFSLSSEKKALINQMVPVRVLIMEPKVMSSKIAPPPPPQPKAVNLKVAKDGNIYVSNFYKAPKVKGEKWQLIENKKVTKEELKNYLAERNSYTAETSKKYNRKYEQQVFVLVEVGADDKQVNELKASLSSLDNLRVVFSTDRIEEELGAFSSSQVGKSDLIVYADRILAFDRLCALEEVKEKVEDGIKTMDNKKTISVLAFSDVPKERLDAVLNELNQIPFKKVSTTVLTKEQKPVSLAQHKVLLKANGKIDIDSKEYDLKEFQSQINEIGNQSSKTNVAFEVEDNVTYIQIETVKQMLREANIDQAGYSIHKHYVRDTEPGTKIGEESTMFWTTWIGAPDLERVKRSAENFLSGKGNRSLYAGITPDKNATKEDIDAVKQVLQDAGFLKVSVQESRN